MATGPCPLAPWLLGYCLLAPQGERIKVRGLPTPISNCQRSTTSSPILSSPDIPVKSKSGKSAPVATQPRRRRTPPVPHCGAGSPRAVSGYPAASSPHCRATAPARPRFPFGVAASRSAVRRSRLNSHDSFALNGTFLSQMPASHLQNAAKSSRSWRRAVLPAPSDRYLVLVERSFTA